MKLRAFSLLTIVLILFTACQDDKKKTDKKSETKKETTKETDDSSKSKAFVAEKYGFSIEFPTKPKKESETQETQFGDITLDSYTTGTKDIRYMVYASALPKMIMAVTDSKAMLKQAKEEQFATIKGIKVISEKDIEIDGHPGVETEAQGDYGGVMSYVAMRLYMVDNKAIGNITFSKLEKKDRDLMFKFLDSFKLIK